MNVRIIKYEDVIHEEFLKVLEANYVKFHHTPWMAGRDKLYVHSLERFFILYKLMDKYSLRNVFFIELDNMIYDSPTKWLTEFSKYDMAYMFDNFDRSSSAIAFIKSTEGLQKFLDHCIQYIESEPPISERTTVINEMTALYRFWDKNQETIQLLPTHWSDKMPEQCSKTFVNYRSLFDSLGIGIYLGGIDPIHSNGVLLKGTKNPWGHIDYTQYKYEWKEIYGRKTPHIWDSDNSRWIRINNLHIHSKDLKSCLSKPFV